MPRKPGTPEYRQLSPEGRVSIPKEYLRAMGLKPGDMVALVLEGRIIHVHAVELTLRS